MGVGRWPQIAARLMAAGRSPETPAAAVRWGSRPEQHTTRATLATLGDHELAAPSVIVVGDVAAEQLDWFTGRPLFGRSVVVTRARAQASGLARTLREFGADVIEAPMIEVGDPDDGGAALAAAVADAGSYDWLVLTSPNGVERTMAHVPDARALAGVRVAAVGTGTAGALARHRVVADLVPESFVGEGLLDAFPAPPAGGGRVLIARAAVAREVVPDRLRAAGWTVDVVDAYRTRATEVPPGLADAVAAADAVTFASSSSVTNLVEAVGADRIPPVVVSIGPVTSETLRASGLAVTAEADPHTVDGLVAALLATLA